MTEEAEIASLLAQNTPEAAARLSDLAQATSDKNTRKAARRALYLLAQGGITPPPSAPVPRVPNSDLARTDLQAWASAFDGAGNRLLFLTWPGPDGGSPAFLQCLVSDTEGVRDIETRRISRKELAERLRGFEAQLEAGIALAPIEADYGRALLHQARALNQQTWRATPPGFLDVLRVIGSPPAAFSSSPIRDAIFRDDVHNDASLPRDPAALFALPWFDAWFLDINQVTGWLAPLQNLLTHPGKNDAVIQEVMADAARDGADRLFATSLKGLYIHRLEESADILRRREQITPARQALFHADALREARTGSASPFAVLLIHRTMQAALEMASATAPIPR